nr:DUF4163 domain-containing protein [uncultured Thiodictyon sp.]
MNPHPRTPSLAALAMLLAALGGLPIGGAQGQDRPAPIEESGQGFDLKATVPVFTAAGADQDAAVAAANRALRTEIEALVAAFRTEQREAAAQGGRPDADWSLLIESEPPERSAHYLAVLITGYDFRGGAHGLPIIEPRVFALTDGRRIPPAGLFRPDADWLGHPRRTLLRGAEAARSGRHGRGLAARRHRAQGGELSPAPARARGTAGHLPALRRRRLCRGHPGGIDPLPGPDRYPGTDAVRGALILVDNGL